MQPDPQSSRVQAIRCRTSARSGVYFGLSLTALMAAAIFVLVYLNPKDASFGSLPLVYAAFSLFFAVALHRLSVRSERSA